MPLSFTEGRDTLRGPLSVCDEFPNWVFYSPVGLQRIRQTLYRRYCSKAFGFRWPLSAPRMPEVGPLFPPCRATLTNSARRTRRACVFLSASYPVRRVRLSARVYNITQQLPPLRACPPDAPLASLLLISSSSGISCGLTVM